MCAIGLIFILAIVGFSLLIGLMGGLAIRHFCKSNVLSRTQLWVAGGLVAVAMLGAGICYAFMCFH
jgi:hypothetical protein